MVYNVRIRVTRFRTQGIVRATYGNRQKQRNLVKYASNPSVTVEYSLQFWTLTAAIYNRAHVITCIVMEQIESWPIYAAAEDLALRCQNLQLFLSLRSFELPMTFPSTGCFISSNL